MANNTINEVKILTIKNLLVQLILAEATIKRTFQKKKNTNWSLVTNWKRYGQCPLGIAIFNAGHNSITFWAPEASGKKFCYPQHDLLKSFCTPTTKLNVEQTYDL